jgi:hypothetical protein
MQDRPSQRRRRRVLRLGPIIPGLMVIIVALAVAALYLPRRADQAPPPPNLQATTSTAAGSPTVPTETNAAPPSAGGGAQPGNPSGTAPPDTEPVESRPAPEPPEPLNPPSRQEQLKEIAAREVSAGTIAYNPPERMNRRESARIEVRITRQVNPGPGLKAEFPGDAPVRVESLPIGTTMKAVLYSTDMEVTPIGAAVKELGSEEPIRWLWEIEPTRSGTAYLYLVVTVLYDEKTLVEKYWTRQIDVQVDPAGSAGSWLGNNWEKFVAALPVLAGAIGAVVAFVRTRWRRNRPVAAQERATSEVSKGS